MFKTSGDFILYGLEQVFKLVKAKILNLLSLFNNAKNDLTILTAMPFSQGNLITLFDVFHQLKTWQIPIKTYEVDLLPIEPIPNEFNVQIQKIKCLLETADHDVNNLNNKYLPSYKGLFTSRNKTFKDFAYWKTGIHHFHLPKIASNGFVRGDNLLFIKVIENKAIFLKIGKHNDLNDREELHTLSEKHTPTSKRLFLDTLSGDPSNQFTIDEHKDLQQGTIVPSITRSGQVYIDSPLLTSGDSLSAKEAVTELKEILKKLYKEQNRLVNDVWEKLFEDIAIKYFP